MSLFITFALAVGSVSLWTLRVALTARGSRTLGSVVAATEAVVLLLAFSHVTGSLDAPIHVSIYGGGVGIGTYVGLSVDGALRACGGPSDRCPPATVQAEGTTQTSGDNLRPGAPPSRAD